MARQYYVLDPKGWTGPFSITGVMKKARVRIKPGTGPFERFKNHKQVGYKRQRLATLSSLAILLKRGGVGDSYSVRSPSRKHPVIQIREAKPSIEVINTNGNGKADKCWTAVIHEFTIPIYFLGSYVCKYVAGSWTLSQHSYGNAVDFGANSMDQLHLIANWLVNQSTELRLEHVIVADTVWTRGYGWSHYSGEYHYHTHADFTPEQSGSCGVKG